MRIRTGPLLLLTILPLLLTTAVNTPTKDDQLLRAVPELVGTRYCDGDAEVYSVWLKLRVRFVNRTDRTLILERAIGRAWYRVKVARNLERLAAGDYEYNPKIDWFFTNKNELLEKPRTDSPGADFVLLAPGGAFESEINTGVFGQYENPESFRGSIRPGVHVFQMELSAWSHPGKASEFAESWRKFGELVTGVIRTEPLEIRIPSEPKVEKNCE